MDVCHTCTHGVALVRIKDAGLKRAARGSREIHDTKIRHLCAIAHLCRAISSQLRHVSTIGTKNLLICNISSRCFHDMVNFGPLAAEICWRVCGTPANFNGFRVLASLLQAAATSLNGNEPNFTRCLAASWTGTLYIVHTPCPEKMGPLFLPLTLPNAGQFSKFFHWQT